MKKILQVMLLGLGLLGLGCERQDDLIAPKTAFENWIGEGQRYDVNGNLRIPTLKIVNGDTTFFPFEKWGIAQKSLKKISDYSCSGYFIYVEIGEDVLSSHCTSYYVYPRFSEGTCNSQKSKTEFLIEGCSDDVWVSNYRRGHDDDCFFPFSGEQSSNQYTYDVSQYFPTQVSSGWSSNDNFTYGSTSCAGGNSTHVATICNSSCTIWVEKVYFYVSQ